MSGLGRRYYLLPDHCNENLYSVYSHSWNYSQSLGPVVAGEVLCGGFFLGFFGFYNLCDSPFWVQDTLMCVVLPKFHLTPAQ